MLVARVHADIGHAVSLPALALTGLITGYVAGMFGMGGGFILMPTLMVGFGVAPAMAAGTQLSQACGSSVASFVKYRKLHRGEPKVDLVMLGGSLIGVDAGTRLLSHLTALGEWRIRGGGHAPAAKIVIDSLFVILLGAVSALTLREALEARHRAVPRGDTTQPSWIVSRLRIPPFTDLPGVQIQSVSVPILAYCGFVIGVLSGLMGLGGGVIFTPLMIYGFGFSVRNAAATGIMLVLATAALGAFEQALRGNVSLMLAMTLLVGSSVGTQLGALTTNYLTNRTLRWAFAGLLVGVMGIVAWDLIRIMG